MSKQEMTGRAKKLKGRVKEAAGILTGDKAMEREGARDRAAGAIDETLGQARRKVGTFLAGVARSIDK
jgi:uncharacterized protein YjbJ (UPF0337 family)